MLFTKRYIGTPLDLPHWFKEGRILLRRLLNFLNFPHLRRIETEAEAMGGRPSKDDDGAPQQVCTRATASNLGGGRYGTGWMMRLGVRLVSCLLTKSDAWFVCALA
jgi:hypothetical protein